LCPVPPPDQSGNYEKIPPFEREIFIEAKTGIFTASQLDFVHFSESERECTQDLLRSRAQIHNFALHNFVHGRAEKGKGEGTRLWKRKKRPKNGDKSQKIIARIFAIIYNGRFLSHHFGVCSPDEKARRVVDERLVYRHEC
jgi:hypothetical protein